ncbi:unnamed protein product, partial [Dibothriocephalus latus]
MGAKDPDQDCDMVTALDRDALTPTELKFLEAARTNKCDILRSIIERKSCNINVKTNLNRTALHMAASQGNLEAVQLLVKAQIIIDTADKHGMTPLYWAAFKDRVDVVLYLIEAGADPRRRTKRGYSLLHVIAKADAIKTMEALLRQKIITYFTELDNDDTTPLMIAASSGSVLSTTVLSKLCRIEEDIDQHQKNLLHMAVLSGSSEVVSVLCENPAASTLINEFDDDGMTPLQYAVEELHYDCAEILLAHGAKPNLRSPQTNCPMITAALKGDIEMIHVLFSGKAGIKQKNRSGNTPLHIASMSNHINCVMDLLQMGADIEVRNKEYHPNGGFLITCETSSCSLKSKELRGTAEKTESSDSISETGTFVGSLSPTEFEQRSKEAGVVLINDQIVVLGSDANGEPDSRDSGASSAKEDDSVFSISEATTYKSTSPHSKPPASPRHRPAAKATKAGDSKLTNGTAASPVSAA